MNSNRPAILGNRRVSGITGLVLLNFLVSAAQVSENDELASAQRQMDQLAGIIAEAKTPTPE